GAEVGELLAHDAVAGVADASLLLRHLVPEARREDPLVERLAADAERLLQALIRPGDESVEGDGDAESEARRAGPFGLAFWVAFWLAFSGHAKTYVSAAGAEGAGGSGKS